MGDRTKQTELPPPMVFMQLLFGKQLTYSLSGVARLGVADHMDKTGRAVEELAAKVGAHAPSLYRVMRMLASLGVFKESPPRHFALTPVGELLKTDAPVSLRYMAMMFGEEFSTRAYAHFTECLRTGGDGVSEAYGKDIWQVLAEHPAQCEVFQNAMSANSSGSVPAIVEAYDFGGIQRIADVGGGHGLLLGSILRSAPKMQGILFDRPEVVGSLPKSAFAGLEGRVAVEGGSFFERVPDGCDAYIMKHIIHDWDDDQCVTILRNCRKVMPRGGRLLIVESVLPPGDTPHPGKILDMVMLLAPGGQERTEEEYRVLLAKADLRLTRVVPTHSAVSLVEAVPA